MSARKRILADFLRDVWNAGDVEACDRYLTPRYTLWHDPHDPWDGDRLRVFLQLSGARG